MIKGLSADNARPVPLQTAKRKTEKQSEVGFADQLMGAKSDAKSENLSRNERKDSGRVEAKREEARSTERERDPRSPSDLRRNLDDVREREPSLARREEDRERGDDDREREEDAESERSLQATNHASTGYNQSHIQQPIRQPAAQAPVTDDEAPIVIENPKGKDSQELKLPDFFSKASLEKGAAAAAAAKGLGANGAVDQSAALAAMKENEGLTRQEAMEKFVGKMQSELGIPPEKLLAAFAKLNDKEMQAAPEQSMGAFLKALGLPKQDEAKAGALYQDLLKTTGDSLMSEHIAGLQEGVNFDVLSPRDSALKKLNSSLDDLNKSFFRKEAGDPKRAQKSLESMNTELSKLMRQPASQKDSQPTSAMAASALLANANANANAESTPDTASAASQSDANALAALIGQQSTLGGAMNASSSQGEGDLADRLGGQGAESSVKSAGGKSALQSAFAEQMSKELKDEDTDGDVDTEAVDKTALAKTDPQSVVGQDQPVTSTAARPLMGPAEMMMNKPATPQDEQANVKELIREAQIMIKRGGGEMKMEMTPEGMGSVHLRVNVQNGQVNVQMLTESESAKHLLEKGLSELKTNLAAHELKVQSLSVDVGNDVKNQMDQQATQDHARQRAQQMASDFMGNFRDEQQGMRQGMMDNRGWRQYGSRNKGPESLQPEQVARATSRSQGDNSKRLNLVA